MNSTIVSKTVEVREVTEKAELRIFVDYPNQLYRGVPQFVPAFYGDDLADWDPKRNPAMEYCEAKCFLAWRGGRVVGRIGAILSHKANEKWGTNRMRFSQVDFENDREISDALFGAVEAWAREKGCTQVHGPLGFCDMDREGMLVEGFDQRSMFITYYNHPYYNEHLTRLGYRKDTDWVEYKIFVPSVDSDLARKLHRIARRVLDRGDYRKVEARTGADFKPYIRAAFELVNRAYEPLYGVVELTPRQIRKYAAKFLPLVDPDFACLVVDKQGELVAFGVCAPSMAEAMQKSRGRLFPTGWTGVLRALHRNTVVDLFLIAVRPDLQGLGMNAVIIDHILHGCAGNGIQYAETGPQLETNLKELGQWKMFDKEQHKRRRCYIKDL